MEYMYKYIPGTTPVRTLGSHRYCSRHRGGGGQADANGAIHTQNADRYCKYGKVHSYVCTSIWLYPQIINQLNTNTQQARDRQRDGKLNTHQYIMHDALRSTVVRSTVQCTLYQVY